MPIVMFFLVMLSVIMLTVKLFYSCNIVIRSGSTLLSFIMLSVVMLHLKLGQMTIKIKVRSGQVYLGYFRVIGQMSR
jgi:hypothetical protein